MPLMAAYEQNDARDAARSLASITLEGLRDNRHDDFVGNAIDNMYRLLQGYRTHGFYGYVDEQPAEDEGSLDSLLTSADRNVGQLKLALDTTFEAIFTGQDCGRAIDEMKNVMLVAAYPEDGGEIDEQKAEQAKRFFAALVENLKA